MENFNLNFKAKDFYQTDLSKMIPDLYRLKKIIENTEVHQKENVFDHTLNTLDEIDKLLSFNWIDNNLNREYWLNYFDMKINNLSRNQVLRVSTLIHDFGKFDTFHQNENNITSCENHEEVSAKYVMKYSKLFYLTNKEIEICSGIIRNHKKPYLVHISTLDCTKEYRAKNIKTLFNQINTYWYDLLLLAIADSLANQLVKTKPNRHHSNIDFYLRCFLGATSWDFNLI